MVMVSLLGVAVAGAADVSRPSAPGKRKASSRDGGGAFATGKYRNLFVEAGHTEAEIDAKIARA